MRDDRPSDKWRDSHMHPYSQRHQRRRNRSTWKVGCHASTHWPVHHDAGGCRGPSRDTLIVVWPVGQCSFELWMSMGHKCSRQWGRYKQVEDRVGMGAGLGAPAVASITPHVRNNDSLRAAAECAYLAPFSSACSTSNTTQPNPSPAAEASL